ncbi:MAG: glycosyltransferase [Leptolyngbyaceae cyanobacterium RM1_406_9]|nr:glycosyltransferase [Leptolyngbyaceae cyanobacterium RM1_406_9]
MNTTPPEASPQPVQSQMEDSTQKPMISVIVPVYNGEVLLPLLLQSLSRLNYPADRLEILIVNNNSSDRTAEILAESPIPSLTVLFETTPGAGTARNAGIRQAKGAFLAFTDADCVVDANWLNDLLAGFTDATIGAVAGTLEPHALTHPVERYEALRLNCPGHRATHVFLPTAVTANVMYRADVFAQVGSFLECTGGEETDLNWRMQTQTPYRINFLTGGGLVWHRYRADLRAFCRTQRYKSRTLIDLHRRWNLRIPTGRKELFKAAIALPHFIPTVLKHSLSQRDRLLQEPNRVLWEGIWEARLDVLVPWERYRGIREGLRLQAPSGEVNSQTSPMQQPSGG